MQAQRAHGETENERGGIPKVYQGKRARDRRKDGFVAQSVRRRGGHKNEQVGGRVYVW